MCGIAGFLGAGDEETLGKMNAALGRRGPDDHGTYLHDGAGLAHTRLSIIDLSASGHQPMKSASGNTVITFNGEIYNFAELRRELEAGGTYLFKSNTDTEVILALYEKYGVEAFSRLNGMFAFGIYDSMRRCLFLARDRVGKKPLYYTQYNGKFVFASELKAILCDAEFPKEIDYRALNFYLTFGYIPLDFTIFKHVRKLSPAHIMVYNIEKDEYEISLSFRFSSSGRNDARKRF